MTFHQIKLFRAIVDQQFHLSKAAEKCFISQPGLSRQILLLEEQLKQKLFIRKGKLLIGLSEAGKRLLVRSDEILQSLDSLKLDLQFLKDPEQGELKIAITHTQAKYFLPPIISKFKSIFPKVSLHIDQGSPQEIANKLEKGEVDFAMATESLSMQAKLIALPIYKWKRVAIVPFRHPLLSLKKVSLKDLARYPLITYGHGIAGRSNMDLSFKNKDLHPEVVLAAVDSDVIKTYVKLGMGVGVIADMAYDNTSDKGLKKIEVIDDSIGFIDNTSYLAFKKGFEWRAFHLAFIEICAPHIDIKKLPLLKESDSLDLINWIKNCPKFNSN